MTLTRLRRLLLVGSALLLLSHFLLVVSAVPSNGGPQIILPTAANLIASAALIVLVLSGLIAAATRQGWRRVGPLIAIVFMVPVVVLMLGFVELTLVRREIGRVTLPGGHIVMMTQEPGFTDTSFGLWRPDGWRWQAVFDADHQITYSEDGSFTEDPALVLAPDGRHLTIRRGGIWTDCWEIKAEMKPSEPKPCLPQETNIPESRSAWLDRSDRITAAVGVEPSRR